MSLLPPSSGRWLKERNALIALMMEATRTSETLVYFYQTTRRYNPEDSQLPSYLLMKYVPLYLGEKQACIITIFYRNVMLDHSVKDVFELMSNLRQGAGTNSWLSNRTYARPRSRSADLHTTRLVIGPDKRARLRWTLIREQPECVARLSCNHPLA
jgi:hypothetical protein